MKICCLPHEIEDAVVVLRPRPAAFGQVHVGIQQRGNTGPLACTGVWLRHDLETMNKRLKARRLESQSWRLR